MKRLVLLVVLGVWSSLAWAGEARDPQHEGVRFQVYKEWPFAPAEAKRRQEETASSLGVKLEEEVALGDGVKVTMVLIPAGEFVVGRAREEVGQWDFEDQRRVVVDRPFRLGKYEVTQAQWVAVTGKNPPLYEGVKYPVRRVSWDDIQKFLEKANARVRGPGFTLPTDLQWGYACRAGAATLFCFGNDPSDLHQYANCADRNTTVSWADKAHDDGHKDTAPVGSFLPNAWGLHDMHGNVWEWTGSPSSKEYEGRELRSNREGEVLAVLRGGSWLCAPLDCRSASRRWVDRSVSVGGFGFRLARPLE